MLRRLAAQRATAVPDHPGPRPAGEADQLSSAQWRLWFLEQMRPGTNAWNTPYAARLTGRLDVDRLRDALQRVVDRHAPLRTVFAAATGEPAAAPQAGVTIETLDLRRLGPSVRRLGAMRFVREEARRPFDLERDLLVRVRLARITDDEHVLVLVAHHIACDGWSKGLLIAELSQAYSALVAGEEPALPELPIEFADYASWERRWLTDGRLEGLEAHWRTALTGAPPALPLPLDHPRPATQAFAGAALPMRLPADRFDAARRVGAEQRATPFMTMLAAFAALMHLRSGSDDVLIASPAALRTHPETEHLIGFFANTLVYRIDASGRPSFRTLIDRTRAAALDVYAHQELPFDRIVGAVNPPRDPSRNPLAQVNFRLEGPEPELELAGVDAEPIELDPGIARFDLAIELGATPDGLSGYFEYDTALFERATAESYATGYVALLDRLVAAPDVPIAEEGS